MEYKKKYYFACEALYVIPSVAWESPGTDTLKIKRFPSGRLPQYRKRYFAMTR